MCIRDSANGASAIHINVFDGETKLDNHPLIDLLARPNPLQAGNEFFQSLYSFLFSGIIAKLKIFLSKIFSLTLFFLISLNFSFVIKQTSKALIIL